MVRRGTGHGPAGGEKTPELPRQYVNFAFYRVDPAWRRLPQREREVGKKEFKGVVEEYAPEMLILPYTLVGDPGGRGPHAVAHHVRSGPAAADDDEAPDNRAGGVPRAGLLLTLIREKP